MADTEDGWGVFVAILAVIVIVIVAIIAIAALLTGGSIFGAGTALKNYVEAFRKNVKPEHVTP